MPLRQWMLRITAYADRLEKDLEALDWPEGIKKLQRELDRPERGGGGRFLHWPASAATESARLTSSSGRPIAAKSGFPQKPGDDVLRIYTTRPDTLFGATYMVIAPEHPFVARLTTPEQQTAVESLLASRPPARATCDRHGAGQRRRPASSPARTRSIPVNGEPVPIWIADYVLCGLRHRRDHGRAGARRARLRVCPAVRPADRRRRRSGRQRRRRSRERCWPASSASPSDGVVDQLRRVQRPADRRLQAADHGRSGQARAWAARRSTTSCATGSSAGSGSGASRFRSCTSWTPTASRPGCVRAGRREATCRSICRTWTTSSRTAAPSRRWPRRRRSGCTR